MPVLSPLCYAGPFIPGLRMVNGYWEVLRISKENFHFILCLHQDTGEWPTSSKPGSKFKVPLLIWAGCQDNPDKGQHGQGQSSRPRKKSKPFISTMGTNWLCKNEGQAPCELKIGVQYVCIDWCWLIYFECQTDCESSVLQYSLNKCELCLEK